MNKLAIADFMTSTPLAIDCDGTLADAHELMRKHLVRHLPVLSRGRLAGIVSERDLHLIETLKDVNPMRVTVEEAMTADVFTVEADASLEETARTMADNKYGSAVVVERGDVIGVFTTTDALRALASILSVD